MQSLIADGAFRAGGSREMRSEEIGEAIVVSGVAGFVAQAGEASRDEGAAVSYEFADRAALSV